MTSPVEQIGQLERRIRISIPLAQIETEVANRLKRIARNAKVAGFRPGKVPMKIVAQQYGGQVRQEVISEAGSRHIGDTLREQEIKIAGMPRIEASSVEPSAEQLEFTATFEVYPEITLGDISQVVIHRPVIEVTEENVDKTIEILRAQRVQFSEVARPAQLGDQVEIDYEGKIQDQLFPGGSAQGFLVTLGEGRTLPEFEGALNGMQAGEEKSFDVTFPTDYHGKEVAGKTAQFHVHLKTVKAPVLPEIGAEFAKELGIEDGDVAKMRAEIRGNVEREVEKRIENKVKEQVMQALLDATPLVVPRALIESEITRMQERMRQDFQGRGLSADAMPMPVDLFEEQAKRRVGLGLILSEVVKNNNLKAQAEQVRAQIEALAEGYERPQEVVAWYYENPTRLGEVESIVLEKNVVSWALERMQVQNQTTLFDELMGIKK